MDVETGELVSDAEVAEVPYVAFTGRAKKLRVHGRLVVRRVKRRNPDSIGDGQRFEQDELLTAWRHHAVFVTTPFEMLQAEGQHRDHAIVAQVIADSAASALAHLSGVFTANAAWAVLWAIAHNLTRAAETLTSTFHARATTATIRTHLINVPARIARRPRRLTLHLPVHRPWGPRGPACTPPSTEPSDHHAPRPEHRPAGHDPRNREWKSRADRQSHRAHLQRRPRNEDPERSETITESRPVHPG